MVQITFVDAAGAAHDLDVDKGTTLMQAALDNGIEGIVAECGGACACATCHCYVDEAWFGKLTPPGDIEKDMLEFVIDPQPTSRLSCQITVDDALEGLVVTAAKSQY